MSRAPHPFAFPWAGKPQMLPNGPPDSGSARTGDLAALPTRLRVVSSRARIADSASFGQAFFQPADFFE
jgi:hypothetical protein